MKKIFAFLSAGMLMTGFSGCGLFARGEEDEVSATQFRLSWQQEQLASEWRAGHCDDPYNENYSASNCAGIQKEISTTTAKYQQCTIANAGLDREKGLSPARAAAVRKSFANDLNHCIE